MPNGRSWATKPGSKRGLDIRFRAIASKSRSDQKLVRRGPRVFAPEIWSENVDEAVRCLSVASFGLRDVFASNLGSEPAPAKAGGKCRDRLFFGDFLLAKQKKVTAARHERARGFASKVRFEDATATLSLTLSPQGRGD